jgi:hypothetical protein
MPLNRSSEMAYIDGTKCIVQEGLDHVSVGGVSFDILIGIATENCIGFDYGIMELDIYSKFLRVFIRNTTKPMVFAFTFKDAETGEGGNWFSMGSHAGRLKGDEIIWTETDKSPSKKETYWIEIPYISYNNKTAKFNTGHSAVVDTGPIE